MTEWRKRLSFVLRSFGRVGERPFRPKSADAVQAASSFVLRGNQWVNQQAKR